MKRIIICAVLFIGALAASVYAHFKVQYLNEEIDLRINALTAVLHEKDTEEIIGQAYSLVDFWNNEEKILVHFVRHSNIDVISVSMARLPALAEYGDHSEVYAELLSIRRQMEHILTAEILTLGNLL